MSSLDKLSNELVKELQAKAIDYDSFEDFEAAVRDMAEKGYAGESTGLSDGSNEEVDALAAVYGNVGDFSNEMARYAQLSWHNARTASARVPQPNAHLTGTPAEGDPDKEYAQHRNVFDRTADEH